jgi:methylamine dehydrogenase heavy chain
LTNLNKGLFMHKKILAVIPWLTLSLISFVSHAELKPEPIPKVETLPEEYPASWIFAHDVNFNSMIAGKVAIIDVDADTREYKGAIDASQMAAFVAAKKHPTLYVAESFYSRGTKGERTDVIAIYDKSSLAKTGEVILPKKNRAQMVTNKFMLQLVDDEKYLLIFAFTPASSVIVMDTQTNELVSEIAIAGCSMIYPAGNRGFASLCGNGTMKAVKIDSQGQESERFDTPPFFDIDEDPLFDKPIYIGNTAYFFSYKGLVQPINLSKSKPVLKPTWSLLSEEEKKQNWRPGGWQIATSDNQKLFYVIMHKDGYNGSHKFGGEEIWAFDADTKKRVNRIALKTNAFSIEVTTSDKPYLAVTNVAMGLDIYTLDGEFVRYINVGDGAMPIVLHSGR